MAKTDNRGRNGGDSGKASEFRKGFQPSKPNPKALNPPKGGSNVGKEGERQPVTSGEKK
jgi:hypothetical protein